MHSVYQRSHNARQLWYVPRGRYQRLPKDAPPVDITLNDVKAEALARDLLVLTLLLELGEALPAGAQLDPSKPRSASAALQVYYVYLGVFMPARQQVSLPSLLRKWYPTRWRHQGKPLASPPLRARSLQQRVPVRSLGCTPLCRASRRPRLRLSPGSRAASRLGKRCAPSSAVGPR